MRVNVRNDWRRGNLIRNASVTSDVPRLVCFHWIMSVIVGAKSRKVTESSVAHERRDEKYRIFRKLTSYGRTSTETSKRATFPYTIFDFQFSQDLTINTVDSNWRVLIQLNAYRNRDSRLPRSSCTYMQGRTSGHFGNVVNETSRRDALESCRDSGKTIPSNITIFSMIFCASTTTTTTLLYSLTRHAAHSARQFLLSARSRKVSAGWDKGRIRCNQRRKRDF